MKLNKRSNPRQKRRMTKADLTERIRASHDRRRVRRDVRAVKKLAKALKDTSADE